MSRPAPQGKNECARIARAPAGARRSGPSRWLRDRPTARSSRALPVVPARLDVRPPEIGLDVRPAVASERQRTAVTLECRRGRGLERERERVAIRRGRIERQLVAILAPETVF